MKACRVECTPATNMVPRAHDHACMGDLPRNQQGVLTIFGHMTPRGQFPPDSPGAMGSAALAYIAFCGFRMLGPWRAFVYGVEPARRTAGSQKEENSK